MRIQQLNLDQLSFFEIRLNWNIGYEKKPFLNLKAITHVLTSSKFYPKKTYKLKSLPHKQQFLKRLSKKIGKIHTRNTEKKRRYVQFKNDADKLKIVVKLIPKLFTPEENTST